jgi:hypothetical protein
MAMTALEIPIRTTSKMKNMNVEDTELVAQEYPHVSLVRVRKEGFAKHPTNEKVKNGPYIQPQTSQKWE